MPLRNKKWKKLLIVCVHSCCVSSRPAPWARQHCVVFYPFYDSIVGLWSQFNKFLGAAAIFWVGLRRGWWLDLISFALKHINKGKAKPSKKKSKHKGKKKSALMPEEEAGLAEAGQEGAAEGGGAAAAKAFFNSMKAKMQGSKTGADSTSGRE